MISTLLIANRGEIAVRVVRSARELGIRTVAVYSDADRGAPHVRAADTAVRIGPAPARESYLDIAAVIEAARRTGADAVHPGYGFLSERPEFARAVAEAGLTFVGPTAAVMERMGRKDTARDVAVAAGVPVIPRFVCGDAAEITPDPADESGGERVVFPVLVKAAAGGGGKGMRIVRDPADLGQALQAAGREALSAFGDDTLLVERYVERGRHVEVQVLADHHGHVVHLFERDCSTQRRHQKVLEEAPAPTISEETRKLLTESAVALAREVGYTNAGTVEFLVEEPPGGSGGVPPRVYFLEMNTRLQVEHPVTELAVRVRGEAPDLVRLQLLVAAGEPLPFGQDDVTLTGHAVEARVYAEDPYRGFLPQAGVAEWVRWSPRARVDHALESGQEVSTSYDPMLGKVIVHGPTREAARQALVTALDDTAILGLTTNLGFLRSLAAHDAFRDAEIDTAWLDRHPDAIRPGDPGTAALLAAWALAGVASGDRREHPFGTGDGWRLSGPSAPVPVELLIDGETRLFTVDLGGAVTSDGRRHAVHSLAAEPGVLRLEIDDVVHEAAVRIDRHRVDVAHGGQTHRFERPDAFAPGGAHGPAGGSVLAPMPGTVLTVEVTPGQEVVEGQVLGVMEAMKMELALKAAVPGTVTKVDAQVGRQVPLGAELFVVEPQQYDVEARPGPDEEV